MEFTLTGVALSALKLRFKVYGVGFRVYGFGIERVGSRDLEKGHSDLASRQPKWRFTLL